jgi:hypothetical protein
MRHATAVSVRQPAIPRGWAILGLALASWALVIATSQIASTLFNYISASI